MIKRKYIVLQEVEEYIEDIELENEEMAQTIASMKRGNNFASALMLYHCRECGAERMFKRGEGLISCNCGMTNWQFVETFSIDDVLKDDKRLRDTNIEQYDTIVELTAELAACHARWILHRPDIRKSHEKDSGDGIDEWNLASDIYGILLSHTFRPDAAVKIAEFIKKERMI